MSGNLLDAPEDCIVHQCNCTTAGKEASGLAFDIFEKFPWANIYTTSTPKEWRQPGRVVLCGDGTERRWVANLMGQRLPGRARTVDDTSTMRQRWFQRGLDELSKVEHIKSFAFPHGIACGLAGGDWETYEKMLRGFSKKKTVIVYVLAQTSK